MSGIYETLAQIQRILVTIPDFGNSIKAATTNLMGLDNYFDILMTTNYNNSKILSEALENFQSMTQKYILQGSDFSSRILASISGINEQLEYIKEIELEAISSISKRLDITRFLANYDFLRFSDNMDYEKLTQAFQNTLDNMSNLQDVKGDYPGNDNADRTITIDTIVDKTQNEYEKICDSDKIEISTKSKYDIAKEIRDWIVCVCTVFSILIAVYQIVSTKPNNSYNTVIEVNNYYVHDLEINADILNDCSYRIINQNNVMPRIKPNRSSRVTGHLSEGQVVQVCDKNKKWVQILWQDEDGNEHMGWVQNYKLEEFYDMKKSNNSKL